MNKPGKDDPHPSVIYMWESYLLSKGETAQTSQRRLSYWHFCDNQKDADELAQLVLDGVKRATCTSEHWWRYSKEPASRMGDAHVITNWAGQAICVIEITKVERFRLCDATPSHAFIEGEGDKSLQYWLDVHKEYFQREQYEIGYTFDERMPVIFEHFQLRLKG